MKKLLPLLVATSCLGCAIIFGATMKTARAVKAEDTVTEPVTTGKVIVPTVKHLQITASALEGEVGETISLTLKTDFAYVLETIQVNGTALSLNKETGTYDFVLVAGDNTITASVIVDKDLLGDLAGVYSDLEASNWDWTRIFTNPTNLIGIITFVLSGGIGVFGVKAYAKFKKEKTITREAVIEGVSKLVPEACAETMSKLVNDVIAPLITKVGSVEEAMLVFSRCLALVQEDTPESRLAILDELSKIKISDASIVTQVETKIKEALAEAEKKYNEQMTLLSEMKVANATAIAESAGKTVEGVNDLVGEVTKAVDDGTSI